ncbi:hypothetical protein Nepgr_033860 [Nepenthes gracilis]|uniref:Uncharacterized protein n=1 Tax=Nepenthes gracilis TaxID=150966 RepID=A0AAD3TMP2_NEPGR|nr:hypothetical protein Nepgr_033860 [Nepenthes gracilis]
MLCCSYVLHRCGSPAGADVLEAVASICWNSAAGPCTASLFSVLYAAETPQMLLKVEEQPGGCSGIGPLRADPLLWSCCCFKVSASRDGPEVFAGAEVASPAGADGLVDVECISGNSAAG